MISHRRALPLTLGELSTPPVVHAAPLFSQLAAPERAHDHARAGRTFPMNKVSAARRLTALFEDSPKAPVPLTAGMTAGSGENFADLLQN